MTDRPSQSIPRNIFFNSEAISDENLALEQNYVDGTISALVNNSIGSGVIPNALLPNIIFDTKNLQGLLDGKSLPALSQPSSNLGNQLSISLNDSLAAGKRTVKVLIIGLDFENNLQYDALIFHRNEIQYTSKHYRSVLSIILNDVFGPTSTSFNLGGNIIITEAGPLVISRDPIMISQTNQPNLFFRDFVVASGGTISNLLSIALPNYNIDALNINIGFNQLRSILENDVSSQIGQKFQASTNNIEKITLLMSVINNTTPSNLVWTGDLIVSVYQLQSNVACQSDIVPNLAIEFDPNNIPLSQQVISYSSLLAAGTQLNTVPQPVDFIFSNTSIATGLVIKPGSYYMVAVKRAGAADTCQIQFATGVNSSPIMRESLFNGDVWVDVPEECLWYQIYTDAAKISSGQAYDNGHGIEVPKTKISQTTALTNDYSLSGVQFSRNDLFYALVQATTQDSNPVQSELTGEPINSEQRYVPAVSLLNSIALSNIQSVSNPLIIGTITDQNVKSFNGSNATTNALFHEYGMVGNEIVIKVITDPTDGYRYDQNIIEIVSMLVNGTINGAKLTPNVANPNFFYRVAKAELISNIYGDINGDGIVDESDLLAATKLIGSNLNVIPTYSQYLEYITSFVSDVGLTWQVVNPIGPVVVASGTDGILAVSPNDGSTANFQSGSANFNSITNLGNFNLVISNSLVSPQNNTTCNIINLIDNHTLTIQKPFLTSDQILSIMRADITNDMIVNSIDVGYITNYITAAPPFPATTLPANRIGTSFNAIRLTLEKYIDRSDDYPNIISNRSSIVHTSPDIFLDGYNMFAGQNLKFNPLPFSIVEQLVWYDYDIVSTSNPRMVAAAFTYQTGDANNLCDNNYNPSQTFPSPGSFDSGKNDMFIPNNIIMNYGGQLIRPDGYFMKMDFEMASIVFEIPEISFDTEHTVNLFSDFVADFTGTGFTRLGYSAMRFADCSLVGLSAINHNQVQFAVAVQSFSPQLDGLDPNCVNGIIVDGKIGVSINYNTGLLTLNFTNLYQDPVKQTLNTKIQVSVYLKKAGWNNKAIFVDSLKTQNIFGVPTPTPSIIVCPDNTVVSIATSGSPAGVNSNITFTAMVAFVGPVPTGPIVFKSGGTTLGVAELNGSAIAALTIPGTTLGSGTFNIIAYFTGDLNYIPGQSHPLVQVIV